MVSPLLADLAAQVAVTNEVQASAVVFIQGFASRLQTAVDAALDGGATKEQMAVVQSEIDSLKLSSDSLASAIVENTPTPPEPPVV